MGLELATQRTASRNSTTKLTPRSRGRLGRGSNELGRGGDDFGRGINIHGILISELFYISDSSKMQKSKV